MKKSCFRECLILLLSLFLLMSFNSKAQGLQIGDPLPDVEINSMINTAVDKGRISDFIGKKALLIDFWSSFCSICIESFPKLDSLQKEFKDDLNILLVNFESKEKSTTTYDKAIARFGKKGYNGNIQLMSVVSDTILHLIFPHTSAPHAIWIDKTGKIKAITDHIQINRKNVRSLISGDELNLPVKKDNMEFSFLEPMIKTMDLSKMSRYYFLSSHQPGAPSSDYVGVDPETGFLKAKGTNIHFWNLYLMAYGYWSNSFNFSRMIIDKSVSERLGETDDRQNEFCYDSWWRDTTRSKALKEMQSDLDHTLDIKSRLEKRKIPVLVLKETGTLKRYKSNSSENEVYKAEMYADNDTLFLKDIYLKYPIRSVFNYGRYAWSPYQFIDETGFQGKMTIRLPEKFSSVEQMNRYLREFDLKVVKEERWMDVIVIKEAISTSQSTLKPARNFNSQQPQK